MAAVEWVGYCGNLDRGLCAPQRCSRHTLRTLSVCLCVCVRVCVCACVRECACGVDGCRASSANRLVMHARRRHLHVLLSPLLCCYAKQKVLRVVCLFVVLSHVALQHGTVVVNSIDGPCRRVTVQAGLKGVELYDHRGDLGNDFNAWENVNLVSENTHTHT